MNINYKSYRIIRFAIVIIIFVLFMIGLNARFLTDQQVEEYGWIGEGDEKRETGFPENVATSIKVSSIDGFYDKVKITWNISEGTTDDFIVARTNMLPNTQEKALKALSIKLVKNDEERVVFDQNLQEGSYYYLVLAKNKITKKNIELYANENYTTSPLVILKTRQDKMLPEKVTGIKVAIIDRQNVFISWNYIKLRDIAYTIYRARQPLSSPAIIRNADKLGIVTDVNSYTDKTINRTGIYYYAIVTSDRYGLEDLNLVPNESYTTRGVSIVLNEIQELPERRIPEVVKPEVPEFPEKEVIIEEETFANIDILLKKTFFKGKYEKAIEKLKIFIRQSVNRNESLKAKLFLGRSHIEIGEYNKALEYLLRKDVKEKFPKEAEFWRDYCLARIK